MNIPIRQKYFNEKHSELQRNENASLNNSTYPSLPHINPPNIFITKTRNSQIPLTTDIECNTDFTLKQNTHRAALSEDAFMRMGASRDVTRRLDAHRNLDLVNSIFRLLPIDLERANKGNFRVGRP